VAHQPICKQFFIYILANTLGPEPVLGTGSGTFKNARFCRISGTGSTWNPKFEKRVSELVPGKSKF
jgi:hypothetical protein